ncbi:hypothetical protein RN001_014271 [Aquatica leii]|uniref:Peptidase S1 domain-containing protein n=1 Tax=Aquatica leii TaxID=1421715 RepID=A0AAN7P5K8_9COLE|nr:hypothetical protein RN001_014271 [Aquatica leii]
MTAMANKSAASTEKREAVKRKLTDFKMKAKKKPKKVEDIESSSEEEVVFSCIDTDDDLDMDEDIFVIEEDKFIDMDRSPIVNDYVLVEYKLKSHNNTFYVGHIMKEKDASKDYENYGIAGSSYKMQINMSNKPIYTHQGGRGSGPEPLRSRPEDRPKDGEVGGDPRPLCATDPSEDTVPEKAKEEDKCIFIQSTKTSRSPVIRSSPPRSRPESDKEEERNQEEQSVNIVTVINEKEETKKNETRKTVHKKNQKILLKSTMEQVNDSTNSDTDDNREHKKKQSAHLSDDKKIANGYDAEPGQFPYIASYRYNDDHYCGCTIISEYWVLTAAHCIFGVMQKPDFDIDNLSIVAGITYLYDDCSEKQVRAVRKQFVHHGYSDDDVINDIGLIVVWHNFVFENNVNYIAYNHKPTHGFAVVVGWGYLRSSYPEPSPNLQYATGKRISNCGLRLLYDLQPTLTNKMTCFMGYYKENETTCDGDSGGPLLQQFHGCRNFQQVDAIPEHAYLLLCDEDAPRVDIKIPDLEPPDPPVIKTPSTSPHPTPASIQTPSTSPSAAANISDVSFPNSKF